MFLISVERVCDKVLVGRPCLSPRDCIGCLW